MLMLNPRSVSFAGATLSDVRMVAVDRIAAREVVEWSDLGPHAVFADAPERKVTIRVQRDLTRDGLDGPRPGDSGVLIVRSGPNASDAGGVALVASAVVMRVSHDLREGSARQLIQLVAVSASGDVDPVVVQGA